MSVITISRDTNNNVSLVRMQVSDNLATVSSANYIADHQDEIDNINGGVFDWFKTDMLLVAASDANALYQFTDNTFQSLLIYGEQGTGTVQPGLQNQIAYYPANGATIAGITGGNNGILATNGTGVPSITSILPSAVQLNITALGTIGAGTWNATPITVPFGGTGGNTFTAYAVICAGTTATGNFQNVSGVGSVGQFLTSNGAGLLPTWQDNPASGVILPGSANAIAYYASGGSILSGINTAISSVFVTSGTGVPSWSTTLPSGLTIPGYATSGANTNITSVLLNQTGLVVKGATANALTIKPNETLTAGRTLNLIVNDADRTLNLGGNIVTTGNLSTAGGFDITFTGTAATAVTLPTSGTLLSSSAIGSTVEAWSAKLDAYAAQTWAADQLTYQTSTTTLATTALTANARSFISQPLISNMVSFLSLTPGVDVQAYAASLQALSSIAPAGDLLPYFTGPTSSTTTPFTSFARTLLSQSTAAAMCTTLNVCGKHAWPISIGAIYPAITSGATITQVESTTNKNNYRGYSFVNGSLNYVHCRIPMPKSWNQSTITAQFYFKTTATTGNVTFQIQAVLRNAGDAEDLAFGTNVTVTTTVGGTAQVENISAETSAMTVAGTPANGSDIEFRISRSAGDTAAAAAVLTGLVLFITTNAGNDA
jgi:hypothetical protein